MYVCRYAGFLVCVFLISYASKDKYKSAQIKIVLKEQLHENQTAESRAGKLEYYLLVNKLIQKPESGNI